MSTSLARSRSLRKPSSTSSGTSASASSTSNNNNAAPDPRHGSPSRLPVKPPTRSISTTTTTSSSTSSRANPGGLGRTASVRQTDASKKESSRYPPSTTTTKPRPAVRPTSSDGQRTQNVRRVPTHTRAKSTATPATTLNPSTVLRPPSQGSSTSGPRAVHRRVASVDKSARPAPAPAPAPSSTPPPATSTAGATKLQPKLRPAFSTLQQHYSPAKSHAPKPLTSTFLAPPSPSKLPANIAASAETSRLQAELLQLHLLHRDAPAVDAEWQASAREKLGERFELLNQASQEVDEQERASREEENVLALRAWNGTGNLEAKIQALNAIISGMWTLTEAGGRYARMIRRFERWLDQVSELHEARREEGALHRMAGGHPLFLEELETPWKDDLSGIIRRLDGWARQLRDIGEPPAGEDESDSTLSSMLRGLRELISGVLEEVHLMEDIEQDALDNEHAWIEATNKMDDHNDTPRAGAIWRVT